MGGGSDASCVRLGVTSEPPSTSGRWVRVYFASEGPSGEGEGSESSFSIYVNSGVRRQASTSSNNSLVLRVEKDTASHQPPRWCLSSIETHSGRLWWGMSSFLFLQLKGVVWFSRFKPFTQSRLCPPEHFSNRKCKN